MARSYVRVRSGNMDEFVDGENYLARTVYESHELVDIGILDEDGNRIMAHERMDGIGFIRWEEMIDHNENSGSGGQNHVSRKPKPVRNA